MTPFVSPLQPYAEESRRHEQRLAFLKGEPNLLTALPSDASKRRYFRYANGLLMDAPSPENPGQFMRIANYLRDLGFSAPQTLKHDLSQGFLALEDFGDATYTKLLQAGEDPYPLYELAVDVLIQLHQRARHCPTFIPPYTIEALQQEAALFVDWYLPHTVGVTLSQADRQTYLNLWGDVFKGALEMPQSVTLRDYHVDNLMVLKERPGIRACGLLDFQEALWGPVVYDLVSLVEDARLDLPPGLADYCWQRYLAAFPEENEEALRRAGRILSAGRHAKIIGIFMRLAIRDGKPKYLPHLPRVWKLMGNCLTHPDLSQLRAWFENHGETQYSL